MTLVPVLVAHCITQNVRIFVPKPLDIPCIPWYYVFVEQMFKTKYALPYPELSPIYLLLGGRVFPLLSPSPDRCGGEQYLALLDAFLA
jgi:hypothetical protein